MKEKTSLPLREQVGSLLRDARIAAGLSQTELAKRLGISSRTILRWEKPTSSVDLGELEVVGRALGLRFTLVATPETSDDR